MKKLTELEQHLGKIEGQYQQLFDKLSKSEQEKAVILDASGNAGALGSATATTQAHFDNTTKLATTAFVNAQGLVSAGSIGYTGSAALTVADVGKAIYYNGAAGTLTLPNPALLLPGSIISVYNLGVSGPDSCTITHFGAETIYAFGNT